MPLDTDPVVDQVHHIREVISETFAHDVRKFLDHLRVLEQEQYRERLIKAPFQPEPEQLEPLSDHRGK
jgi:hypothetical protein